MAYPSCKRCDTVKYAVLVFDQTKYNYGSHYSTSSGKFSAPVTGLYLVTVQMVGTNHTSDYWLNVHNGIRGEAITRSPHINYVDSDGVTTATTSVVVKLTQGHHLYVLPAFTGSNVIYGNSMDYDMMGSFFSAILLSKTT